LDLDLAACAEALEGDKGERFAGGHEDVVFEKDLHVSS